MGTRQPPRSYIAAVTLAYFGLTGATFAPLQNVIPRMIGIMNIANTVPQVIGPPVAAGLIYLGAGYRGLFAFAAVLALLAAYIIYRLRLPG